MTLWRVENMSVKADDNSLVEQAGFSVQPGELVALIGPNGAGKTSLIRGGLGLIETANGTAALGGANVSDLSAAARARAVSYLPQTRPLAWPLRVRDVVALGRYAHGGLAYKLGAEDKAAVDQALTACELLPLADRATDTLSGGELARVHCARAFANGAPLLVADEPVAALDPYHQFAILELIDAFVGSGGAAFIVLHDLSLAARFASRLIWMKDGRVEADGSAQDTMTAQNFAHVFNIDARYENGSFTVHGKI